MLELGGKARNLAEGRKKALARLADGSAWKVFEQFVARPGRGTCEVRRSRRPASAGLLVVRWKAPRRGYIARMDTEAVGRLLIELGGGRVRAEDSIDHRVGFVFHRKLGAARAARRSARDRLCPLGSGRIEALEKRFLEAVEISGSRKPVPKLIVERI